MNYGFDLFYNSYHKEGEKNKYKVFVLRTNAVASFAYYFIHNLSVYRMRVRCI